jgi:membrane protease YdiL (CAAX protease family)
MERNASLESIRGFAGPILVGAGVAIAGIAPWPVLASLNARYRPDLPWAALATLAFLILFVAWLNGAGWPKRSRETRRYRLRLWRPTPRAWSAEGAGPTLLLLGALAMLYMFWIIVGGSRQPPDLSEYPTTAFRISIVIMGAVVSGVVEEVAFRGYMQSGLERYGAGTAIVVTSIVFALFHGVHGITALLVLGPGLFVASVLYGMLAYHTGSIVPGIAMHVLGDLSFTLFGALGGDFRLLVAG